MRVTIYTQAYNAERYLGQCVESVLAQTCPDFEYVLIDDGSTDATPELMAKYAARDSRVHVIRFEQNQRRGLWLEQARRGAEGEYVSLLDADDWLEPDYLERLLTLAETTGAGIICTGTLMHNEAEGKLLRRESSEAMAVSGSGLGTEFHRYHKFLRPNWAKLIRSALFQEMQLMPFQDFGTMYGWDTMISMGLLRAAKAVYVDTSLLHHYRIYSASISYRYDPRRFDSDVCCYRDAMAFLTERGGLTPLNDAYVSVVFSYALMDTLDAMDRAQLPPLEALAEYRRIVGHPVTREVFGKSFPGVKTIGRSREKLMDAISACGNRLAKELAGK